MGERDLMHDRSYRSIARAGRAQIAGAVLTHTLPPDVSAWRSQSQILYGLPGAVSIAARMMLGVTGKRMQPA